MEKQNEQFLQKLPSVDALLQDVDLKSIIAEAGRKVVVDSIRRAVDEVRQLLIAKPESKMDQNG